MLKVIYRLRLSKGINLEIGICDVCATSHISVFHIDVQLVFQQISIHSYPNYTTHKLLEDQKKIHNVTLTVDELEECSVKALQV